MIFTWFTVPDATSTLASIGDYAGPMFNELLPIILIGLGLLIGGGIIVYVARMVMRGTNKVIGKKGGRRRRR